MIAGKYVIHTSEYPYNGIGTKEYVAGCFLVFIIKLAYCVVKYPIVDIEIRNMKRMNK